MIISCPHCETRYQVTYEAIGASGRKVQCAHCQKAWSQGPLDPEPIEDADLAVRKVAEDASDEALAAEERRVAAEVAERLANLARARQAEEKDTEPAKVDPALMRKRQRAFSRRHHDMVAKLPMARVQRVSRVLGCLVLVGLGAGSYFGRVQMVEQFPAMAGVYAAVGLPVNVLGLQFKGLTTLRTLRDGKEVLIVSADIIGLQKMPVPVPAVVVTLLDAGGTGIYEWSVAPEAADLMTGEHTRLETQLPLPPSTAARVRLSFTGGGSARSAAPIPPVAEDH
ncbi:zinc-ribbon domain-containing protein [uncultured Devosia sp.]|uniref:zinc-ribbon domain-containing protein n=1 Tax=uncultured Devosia sp. TaxID=211434 RepID=UPI0035CBEDE0